MTFEEMCREAARAGADATAEVMKAYRRGYTKHEDDLTGVLVGELGGAFRKEVDGLEFQASIMTHRRSGEEGKYGADLLIHVSLDTPTQRYSKGVLVQAKRKEPGYDMSKREHDALVEQCKKMLEMTPASFVFDYARAGMRCGSASKISGGTSDNLYRQCEWTPYRFFLELFRCPVGDPRITSALVDDLPIPHALLIKIAGQLDVAREPLRF